MSENGIGMARLGQLGAVLAGALALSACGGESGALDGATGVTGGAGGNRDGFAGSGGSGGTDIPDAAVSRTIDGLGAGIDEEAGLIQRRGAAGLGSGALGHGGGGLARAAGSFGCLSARGA